MNEFAEFRLFLHLATTLHYGRTAADCHISQPTLSRTITRIERQIGARLFERDRRGVYLTSEGARFRRVAEEILSAWESFAEGDPSSGTEVRGTVALYCSVTASQTLLPNLLRVFHAAHPAARLALHTGYADDALAKIDDGTVQVAIAPLPDRMPRNLLVKVIARANLVPVAAVGHNAAPGRKQAWKSVPFVLPSSGLVRNLIDQWLARNSMRPASVTEAVGHEAVLALVAAGWGVGIVPDLVAAQSALAGGFRTLRPPSPLPSFDVGVCTHPDHLTTRVVDAFWTTVSSSR
ncbi:MAG TPA: HTH-type transcriptional activator IlvY [Acidimicrobiales bacterium]|nr:HTH-type transcriptional activator IlvY [Acidimicrobiales bacterium]